ncbi:ArnT family glycosyltransferase [Granulicella tundricola]|uniref:Dolichyl-phosphate-mannose-protein mannosyltransferase family protein n=1 Tax=Granulicella tundricola (strain ATCC BAA-1859 / DSM 23138 / MP5ACTX9) TaxID=1198114 RepID=E8WZ14_GRATM|nr:glycosyltransferase family 39 protein [Granulicella tundricola]ADW69929.1 dolichyl-phosphate-mannose-protein mannosyltransferase family protein [Granulicella tundricola MP5ACTX9]
MNEIPQPAESPDPNPAGTGEPQHQARAAWLRHILDHPFVKAPGEIIVLFGVGLFLLLFGLIPHFGGDQIGLVGADEPRYAQVAREMLTAHDQACGAVHATMFPRSLRLQDLENSYHCLTSGTVTPILYGQPWLEKPALYYWRAMSFFREFGVSDWSARLPSFSGAGFLVLLIFLHMRRFRPGGHLDAALITCSCVAIISFSRGASTDMQLAAPFCIGMLGWYAWYETGKKFWLFDLYFFGAAATLAKGPVAPFLALVIIFLFVALRREWTLLRRTIWLPGVILYLVMVLPWYIAVQRRNPTFVRQFILEHNLERFATNRYQHHQPVWYYAVVLLIGLMPWTILGIRALIDAIQISIAEWRVRRKRVRYLGHSRAGDAFPEFLVLWAIFPIVFFSFSGSKLPGYILPSIPPLTILTGDYLYRIRRTGLPPWLRWSHAVLCAILVFILALAPQHMKYETLVPSAPWLIAAGLSAVLIAMLVSWAIRRFGIAQVRNVTLVPVIGSLIFLLGFEGHELDLNYSARPLAQQIAQYAPAGTTLAVLAVKRDMDYGLAFYRNQQPIHYGQDGVPAQEHILVVRSNDQADLDRYLTGRIYKPLFLYESQGLEVYKVYARTTPPPAPIPTLTLPDTTPSDSDSTPPPDTSDDPEPSKLD